MEDLEQRLRQVRVRDPQTGLRERVLAAAAAAAAAPAPVRVRLWVRRAAAAVLAGAVGLGAWLLSQPNTGPTPEPDEEPAHDWGGPVASTPVPLLDGRGRLIAVGADTEYTVVDAAAGRIRLARGEVYLDIPGDAGLRAEIETPAGTGVSPGLQAYVRYAADARTDPMMTVAVIGGSIEVRNPHGRTTGDAGEVVVVERGRAPSRQEPTGPGPQPRVWGMGGPGLGPGGTWLLHRPDVQAELKLSDDQKRRLHAVGRDEWNAMRSLLESLHRSPREDRSSRLADFHATRGRLRSEILTAEQAARLRQIVLQQEGNTALTRASTADELGLSEAQRRAIEAAVREAGEASAALVRGGVRNWDEIRRKRSEIRRKTTETIQAVLTVEQQQRWKEMLGEPFVLSHMPSSLLPAPPWGRKDAGREGRRDGERREAERRDGR